MSTAEPADARPEASQDHTAEEVSGHLRLSWPEPARDWNEAVPVGNGLLGGMVFGGGRSARIQVNDATVWSGTPAGPALELNRVVQGGAGPDRLAAVRAALAEGDYRTAESLLMAFEGSYTQEFLPFVDLSIEVAPSGVDADATTGDSGDDAAADGGGERILDLDDAVVLEHFTAGGVNVRRRTWASHPAGVLCVRIESDRPIDVTVGLSTPLRSAGLDAEPGLLRLAVEVPIDGAPLHEEETPAFTWGDGDVEIDGTDASGRPRRFDPFAAAAVAVATDGTSRAVGDSLVVERATEVFITLASSTNALHWWRGDDLSLDSSQRPARLAEAEERAVDAAARGPVAILDAHLADIRPLLGATTVTVGSRRAGTFDVATEVFGEDDGLQATVLVQFGRYLLASASRPGGPPANLQGIWNDQLRAAWSSNYTVNINTEMNYWGAETAGLAECHLPLMDLLGHASRNGAAVAEQLYGARGWVVHHNTDLWGWALPVGNGHGDPGWAIWMLGGTWLSDHLWQHWEFTHDLEFLRDQAWPLLVGAAEFALSWLIDDGDDGWLRTSPSTSPENTFLGPDGHPESLGDSSPMDLELFRKLFGNVLDAGRVLGEGGELLARVDAAMLRLRPLQITAGGWLQEWDVDHVEEHPQHRHMSQMVALYPLGTLDPAESPELAEAAAALLDRRGPGAMGWSWAWKIALRARLGDGETARSLLREATEPFTRDAHRFAPVDGSEWGGLLPNLFSTHPPFQIDGNYGFVAGIVEMLVQSESNAVRLLPALPSAWSEGSVRGVRARGGLAVDVEWAGGVIVRATVRRLAGDAGADVVIVGGGVRRVVCIGVGESVDLLGAAIEVRAADDSVPDAGSRRDDTPVRDASAALVADGSR
ncbi:glycosyl hydrolase family 95 catalytic domain-containing protein [Plantibacter sp. YIM 135249]|uniref:glycosyl hydrolase family 95 catalytic domain-containing protein n=1 Tax=Plantibacter sp. YIM 135249 TaxID=3423918 RepID=UPI003D32DF08